MRQCQDINFSTAAFRQLQSIRMEHGNEAGELYWAILACLKGELECPMRRVRHGRIRIHVGPYRAIINERENGCDVLRIYRAAST